LKSNLYTAAAVDNIDHNPSATTAMDSTGISLIQHPTGTDEREYSSSVSVNCLPHFYTNVPPVTSTVKQSALPATSVISLEWDNYRKHAEGEYRWLENTRNVLEENADLQNILWAAYRASEIKRSNHITNSLTPPISGSTHTVAMIKHSMDMVKGAVEHLNSEQTPVPTFD